MNEQERAALYRVLLVERFGTLSAVRAEMRRPNPEPPKGATTGPTATCLADPAARARYLDLKD